MANGNIDLFDTILQQRIDKSAEQIGQAGSDAQSNQSFGGMIGGLLGQYGVPALLSLIPGVGPGLAAIASELSLTDDAFRNNDEAVNVFESYVKSL